MQARLKDRSNIYWPSNIRNQFFNHKEWTLISESQPIYPVFHYSAHSFWLRGAITFHQSWKMASCHSPLQNRYNRSSISQVHQLDCRLADWGHYTWAVEPSSSLSAGFSVPKCWGFCASRMLVKCIQSTRQDGERPERLQEKMMLGARCCDQDTLHLIGNTPESPVGKGLPGAS